MQRLLCFSLAQGLDLDQDGRPLVPGASCTPWPSHGKLVAGLPQPLLMQAEVKGPCVVADAICEDVVKRAMSTSSRPAGRQVLHAGSALAGR